MASLLVPIADALAVLADVDADDADAVARLTQLVDDVEAAFLRKCGRSDVPFGAVDTARTEVYDGNGSDTLFLEREIVTLTSVKLGYDSSDPDETLDVDDQEELNWRAGSDRIRRLDGVFGFLGQPNYVEVIYSAAADLPRDAAHAVVNAAAAIWRRMGSEGLTSERIGPYDDQFADVFRTDQWLDAVSAHRKVRA